MAQLFRAGLVLLVVWVAACSDANQGSDDLSASLSCDIGKASGPCGNVTCNDDEVCARYVFGFPLPSEMGTSAPYIDYCATVPTACACDPTCACLDAHGGSASVCAQVAGGAQGQCSAHHDDGRALVCVGM